MEKERNGWLKSHWQPLVRLAAIAAISLAPVLIKDKTATATGNAEVGGLAIEPIHLIVGEAGRFEYKDWNLSRLWPSNEDNPELLVRQAGTGYPKQLLLTTTVTADGVKICAYNYPRTDSCDEIEGTSVSQYLIKDTGILSPNTYLEVGSTRLKILNGSGGRYTIVMELTDPATGGLAASSSATIEVPELKRVFLPYVGVKTIGVDTKQAVPNSALGQYNNYFFSASVDTWRPSEGGFPHFLDLSKDKSQTGDYFYPNTRIKHKGDASDYPLQQVIQRGRVFTQDKSLVIKACYNTEEGEQCKIGTDISSMPRLVDVNLPPDDSIVYNLSSFRYVLAESGFGQLHLQQMLWDSANGALLYGGEINVLVQGRNKSYLPVVVK